MVPNLLPSRPAVARPFPFRKPSVSEQYFIRVRGRVQGPFDADKLRQLARRGQFSRLHEISTDSQQWLPAKSFPDLFAASPAVSQPESGTVSALATEVARGMPAPAPSAAPQGNFPRQDVWYYGQGGTPTGPVDFLRLSNLIAAGQLGPDTSVWREGMADWVPAHTVPGLVSSSTGRNESRHSRDPEVLPSTKGDEIGHSIARVLEDSRPWVIFLSIAIFIYAALMFVGGIFYLILGARLALMPVTAAGLSSMVGSAIVGVGGYLLMSYANGIARFDRSRREETLRVALSSLKAFWVYLGVLLIVFIALGVIAAIIAFATIGSIPNFRY